MTIKVKSLQAELYLWIIASTILIMLVGGIISGSIAFFQARELQDNTLKEISLLIKDGQLTPPENISELHSKLNSLHSSPNEKNDKEEHDNDYIDDDASIILLEIKPEIFEKNKKKHLWVGKNGFQTFDLIDEQWRGIIITQKQTDRKFLIAQPTELRDEIAISSAISSLYPILIFSACLLLLVHLVLRKQFGTIKRLTNTLDQQDGTHLDGLSENEAPSEIQPFIRSINALIQRVQSTMEKQQRFIADAAHELRTPIAALSLQAENLQRANNKEEHEERLSSLQQGFHRLGNLVGQLLDLARLQANAEKDSDKNKSTTTASLNDIVKNVVQDLYPIAEKNNIDLGVIHQDSDLTLKDTNEHLSQIVQNAVANAIHYTPENGEVNISLLRENNIAILLIEDTGSGIPEDELEKVMQPFYRVLASGKTGNGLGLTISKEIADKLGGKITLANRPDGGLVYRYEQALVL